jgi:hypothetical protein
MKDRQSDYTLAFDEELLIFAGQHTRLIELADRFVEFSAGTEPRGSQERAEKRTLIISSTCGDPSDLRNQQTC